MKGAAALAFTLLLGGTTAENQAPAQCPGPRAGWLTPRDGLPDLVVLNRIRISGTGITWNGVPVTRSVLRKYLGIVRTMEPHPLTILIPERDADCALLETIRDDMARALPCARNGCGEGRGSWDQTYMPRSEPNDEADQTMRDVENAVANALANVADAEADAPPKPE